MDENRPRGQFTMGVKIPYDTGKFKFSFQGLLQVQIICISDLFLWFFDLILTVWYFFGPYNILWVTSRSINCHMTLSAMNYLLIMIQEATYFYIYLLSAFFTIGPNFSRYSGVETKMSSVSVKSLLKTFVKYKLKSICRRKNKTKINSNAEVFLPYFLVPL